jgi:hypothetical protein
VDDIDPHQGGKEASGCAVIQVLTALPGPMRDNARSALKTVSLTALQTFATRIRTVVRAGLECS